VVASSVPGPSDRRGRTALPTRAACLLLAALPLGCGARSELPDRLTEGVPESCATLHAEKPTLPSGAYQLDTAGVVWRTYCDMDHDGGGWTLLLKTDGRAQTFAFDAPIWTDDTLIEPTPVDLSLTEAKLAGYAGLSMVELRVVLAPPDTPDDTRAVTSPLAADSLATAIASGFTPLTVSRAAWLALVPGAILQQNCGVSGIDAAGSDALHARARIGVIANQENDCVTPDSFVGVGTFESMTTVTTGAFCDSEWCKTGPKLELARFAWVFAR
jgi:hypothetical protein